MRRNQLRNLSSRTGGGVARNMVTGTPGNYIIGSLKQAKHACFESLASKCHKLMKGVWKQLNKLMGQSRGLRVLLRMPVVFTTIQ